jgi:glycosyltransferase involved in cell wall biosynthesis
MDVLVVPSMLAEAFGMVAAEAAAAGVLPLVARHSSLAEVAVALEEAVGRPGLLSFEPGGGASRRVAEAIRRILELDPADRAELGAKVSRFVASEWTWERTAERILEAGGAG